MLTVVGLSHHGLSIRLQLSCDLITCIVVNK